MTTRPYKAIVAGVLAFATALYASVVGNEDLDTLGTSGWLVIVLGALVTSGATWGVTNPPTANSEDGAVNWLAIIAVAVVVIAVLLLLEGPLDVDWKN